MQAQRKARADLDIVIQQGKNTVRDEERKAQTMADDNADLANMINGMK